MEGRIFALDQQTLIQIGVQLLNAGVLAALLTWLLYKPVRKFMQKRADGISAQLARAQDETAMAESLKILYEDKVEEFERGRAQALEEAQRLADEKRIALVAQAQRDADSIRAHARAEMALERERAAEEQRLQAIGLAKVMAGKYAAASLDAAAQTRIFDETLAELEGMAWQA